MINHHYIQKNLTIKSKHWYWHSLMRMVLCIKMVFKRVKLQFIWQIKIECWFCRNKNDNHESCIMFRCLLCVNPICFNIKKHILGQHECVCSIFSQKVKVLCKGIQNNKNLLCLWRVIVTLITILKNDKGAHWKQHVC